MNRFDKDIQAELDGHLADAEADLVASGADPAAAATEARHNFGDMAAITSQLRQLRRWGFLFDPWIVWWCVYGTVFVATTAARLANGDTDLGLQLQAGVLLLLAIGVTAWSLNLSRWWLDFFGQGSLRGPVYAAVSSLLLAVVITRFLDINNFEVVVQNSALALLGLGVYRALQARWPTRQLRFVVYAISLLITWSALVESSLLDQIGRARCLFIRAADTPLVGALADCRHVSWFSQQLLPIYLIVLVGAPVLLWGVWRLVRSPVVQPWRKLGVAATVAALLLFSVIAPDRNNQGQLDVIFWQADIYRVYWDVLGRRPEAKDIAFYARTRAYQQPNAIRQVLLASPERRYKISATYKEVLDRPATAAEIDAAVGSQISIDALRSSLAQ